MSHRARRQSGGLFGIRAVAFENRNAREGAQIGRDVSTRRLHVRGDRNAEAVVLDVEEHRQT